MQFCFRIGTFYAAISNIIIVEIRVCDFKDSWLDTDNISTHTDNTLTTFTRHSLHRHSVINSAKCPFNNNAIIRWRLVMIITSTNSWLPSKWNNSFNNYRATSKKLDVILQTFINPSGFGLERQSSCHSITCNLGRTKNLRITFWDIYTQGPTWNVMKGTFLESMG